MCKVLSDCFQPEPQGDDSGNHLLVPGRYSYRHTEGAYDAKCA